jgi:hypothetical protein
MKTQRRASSCDVSLAVSVTPQLRRRLRTLARIDNCRVQDVILEALQGAMARRAPLRLVKARAARPTVV